MATAYSTHPKILAARQALRIANEQYPQAIANWLPTLSSTMSATKDLSRSETDTLSNSKTNSYKNTLSYSQNLYQGGRNFARLDKAKITVLSQRASLLQTEQAVLLDVAKAYMDVIRDRKIATLRTANTAILSQILQSTQVQYDLQQRTVADLSQAQARLRAAEATVIGAENTVRNAEEKYRELIGQLPTVLDFPGMPGGLPATIDDMSKAAEQQLPAVVIARFAVDLAELDKDIENGARLPTFAVQTSMTDSRSKEVGGNFTTYQRDISTGVTLTIPLYQSGAELSRVRAARRLISQRQIELRDARRIARRDAQTAWRNLESARAQMVSLRAAAKAAETARDGISKELDAGRRSLLDLLNSEQELLNARVSAIGGERDVVVAAYEVLNAAGSLTARALDLPTPIYDPAPDLQNTRWNLLSTSD